MPRGSQLILRYTGGSPCALGGKRKRSLVHEGASYKHFAYGDEKEEVDEGDKFGSGSEAVGATVNEEAVTRRKSAIITFRCDRDPATLGAKMSFIEMDEDECTYVLSVLSQHACAKSEPHKPGSVGPASVFAIIFFVAVFVYIAGGVVYQRTVAHARGWRQLPNYSLWAGMGGFFKVRSIRSARAAGSLAGFLGR